MRHISLIGGGSVLLRCLTPADGPALAAGNAELSARSLYLRYHAHRSRRLTEAEVTYLTDVDQQEHVALILFDGAKGIAVGRYVRLGPVSNVAEVALTVLDAWQGRGLSKLLLAALMQIASRTGIGFLGAAVMGENTVALRLLASLGAVPQRTDEENAWWAEVGTNPGSLPLTPGAEALRHYHRLLADCFTT